MSTQPIKIPARKTCKNCPEGTPQVQKVSQSDKNPGRAFMQCANCRGFVYWCEDQQQQQQPQVVSILKKGPTQSFETLDQKLDRVLEQTTEILILLANTNRNPITQFAQKPRQSFPVNNNNNNTAMKIDDTDAFWST